MVLKKIIFSVVLISFVITISAFSIILSFMFFFNAPPHVSNENVIREYRPLFSEVFSLNIDKDENFYIQTENCTLCFDADWDYKQSYIFSSERMASILLSINEQGLFFEEENGAYTAIITFDGAFSSQKSNDFHKIEKTHNLKVQTKQGETYSLKAYAFWAKVIDGSNHTVWHSSYFSGIVLFCLFCFMPIFIISALLFATKYKNIKYNTFRGLFESH